jgi:hypothetical protein
MDQDKYLAQMSLFLQLTMEERPEFENRFYKYPMLNEDVSSTSFDTHYLYHVAWGIRKIQSLKPPMHVDFSSSLNFCTATSAICPTLFYDFRPATIFLDNLTCLKCDLMAVDFEVGQYPSVSSMHVVEHVGMGRYGDTLNVNGDLLAIENLKKTVMPGGAIFFVVPCGKPSVQFNAHRVYSAKKIIEYFGDEYTLKEFYFIPGPIEMKPVLNPDLDSTLIYDYGCGCFHFQKEI